jgi:hypothetical protein
MHKMCGRCTTKSCMISVVCWMTDPTFQLMIRKALRGLQSTTALAQ